MPDSPLLTPEAWQAAAEVCVQHNQLPLELDALRAFLAAHDPEALAERVAKTLPTADLPEFSATWADDPLADEWAHLARVVIDRLGLGGDDD